MELERQLQMVLREKKWLEDSLQKTTKLLEESRNRLLMDNRKMEQTQAMYDELKERYVLFTKTTLVLDFSRM